MEKAAISAQLRESDFERVFQEHYSRVYAVLVHLVGDRAEAQDLALETFWQLYRRTRDVRGLENPGGWLYRVATNLGLNALRARKRRERYEAEGGGDALKPKPAADPEELAAAQDERDQVRRVLAQMDSRQGQLLLLRHSGMSYEEVAAALGVSPNSIGTLLVRAELEFEKKWQNASRAPHPTSPSEGEGR
jgi:RNA polymerase sigma-70 factor, ECF subfamily